MMRSVTTLNTARLSLRPLTVADAPAIFRLGSDQAVMQYIGSPLFQNEAQARQYLLSHPLADYQRDGFGRLAITEQQSGVLISFCGIKYVPELAEYDLGYRLLPAYWGQGFISEACQAVLQDARAKGLRQVLAIVHPDNQPSCKVLTKLGFTFEKRIAFSLLPKLGALQFRLALVQPEAEVVA